MRRRLGLIVFVLSSLPFLPTLFHGFTDWDDPVFIVKNRALADFDWGWIFTSTLGGHYHPLTWLSLALDRSIWGPGAFGVHLTNVLLHAACAALFFSVAKRLLGKDSELQAAAAALLFAVHPLRAESVAWAIERRDVLSGVFYLWTIKLWLEDRTKPALWAFAASLLSKGIGVTLPIALLLIDSFGRGRKLDAAWLRKAAPFAGLSIVVGALGLWFQRANGAGLPLAQFPLTDRLLIAAYGLVFYPWKTLLPTGLIPLVPLPKTQALWPLLPCAAGLAATVWAWRRHPKLAACALYYAATVAPVLGVFRFGPQLAADRYSYLACLPFALVAGRALPPQLSLAAVILLGGMTVRQVGFWKNGETLWTRELSVRPDVALAHHNMANNFMGRGRPDLAEKRERDALALDPAYNHARNGLGLALAAQGRFDEALPEYRAAIAAQPDYWEARANLAMALAQKRRFVESFAEFEQALKLAPSRAELHGNYGLALLAAGEKARGAAALETALRLNPNQPRLASIYQSLR